MTNSKGLTYNIANFNNEGSNFEDEKINQNVDFSFWKEKGVATLMLVSGLLSFGMSTNKRPNTSSISVAKSADNAVRRIYSNDNQDHLTLHIQNIDDGDYEKSFSIVDNGEVFDMNDHEYGLISTDINNLHTDIADLRKEMNAHFHDIDSSIQTTNKAVNGLPGKINDSKNKNWMLWATIFSMIGTIISATVAVIALLR